MTTLEELGLLKMDFLGLRTLTVIQDAIRLVEKSTGVKLVTEKLNYNDKAVLDYIGTGKTDGIFQIESAGMKSFMEGTSSTEFGRYYRRNFSLPARSDGFHPTVYQRKKPSGADYLRMPAVKADPGTDLWLHCIPGTGYADRA